MAGRARVDDENASLAQLMAGRENNTKYSSQLNIERDPEARSDSPILEGIDSDLAKYAELKDLERAYKPKNNQYCDKKTDNLPRSLRHPDGASNPDLKSRVRVEDENASPGLRSSPPMITSSSTQFSPPLSTTAATLPRRSPGEKNIHEKDAEIFNMREKKQDKSIRKI